jgi:hypothetical protein
MTAKRSKKSRAGKGGRVTPKGTRPPDKTKQAATESEPRFSVRHAQRSEKVNQPAAADRKPTGARPTGRGNR